MKYIPVTLNAHELKVKLQTKNDPTVSKADKVVLHDDRVPTKI